MSGDLLLSLAAVPLLLAAAYLGFLALFSGAVPAPNGPPPPLFFDLIVPAHDEEKGLPRTLRSLRALEWREDRMRIVVVADNCLDRTAEVAAAEGAQVLRRDDPGRRGKGYALELAFAHSLSDRRADAVVVVDADTSVPPDLLRAFARRLGAGARAVQADYGVRNAGDSWRTRLLAVALATFHGVRSRARERLGLSCGLRGNGMCFSVATLRAVPYGATSVVEDVEYGLDLAQAGVRVEYAGEVSVAGEMPATAGASGGQRRRWERGRRSLLRRAPRLLALAARWGDRVLLDLAIDLLVPPLSTLALGVVAGLGAALLFGLPVATALFAAAGALLVLYLARGWAISGTGARGLLALAYAPAFVAWKVGLALRARGATAWTRTERTA